MSEIEPIGVLGAGAFGTALAMTQSLQGRPVTLWGRDSAKIAAMQAARANEAHLPGMPFPPSLRLSSRIEEVAGPDRLLLVSVPTQQLRALLTTHRAALEGSILILCCKGVERGTGLLPSQVVASELPRARIGVLSGPSFAVDIAQGKPTALTLATTDPEGPLWQELLSTLVLRLYLGDDPLGAQLGGALKNVIAIAAGIAMGAGLGESARAALMTRGFTEMIRYADSRGAKAETLFGLSGFGDLVLTCSSSTSRNYSHGFALGAGTAPAGSTTVEGVMTAHAVTESAAELDLPITQTISAFLKGQIGLEEAGQQLLSRPHKREGLR